VAYGSYIAACTEQKQNNSQLSRQVLGAILIIHIEIVKRLCYTQNGLLLYNNTCVSGREQADMTGEYLKSLGLNYTKIVSSTLTRAVETSDIIYKHLPQLPEIERDELLCEGQPIVPEPYLHWRPPHKVMIIVLFFILKNFSLPMLVVLK
jgi:serine/threonine-protein phosphatase PGAM5